MVQNIRSPHADGTIGNFEYYFAQRESVETVIYLHEFVKVKDKHDLLRFDTRGVVPPRLIEETWRRYVVKMATGSGKTKTMSLLLAWSYFHKKYEEELRSLKKLSCHCTKYYRSRST